METGLANLIQWVGGVLFIATACLLVLHGKLLEVGIVFGLALFAIGVTMEAMSGTHKHDPE